MFRCVRQVAALYTAVVCPIWQW